MAQTQFSGIKGVGPQRTLRYPNPCSLFRLRAFPTHVSDVLIQPPLLGRDQASDNPDPTFPRCQGSRRDPYGQCEPSGTVLCYTDEEKKGKHLRLKYTQQVTSAAQYNTQTCTIDTTLAAWCGSLAQDYTSCRPDMLLLTDIHEDSKMRKFYMHERLRGSMPARLSSPATDY